MVEVVKSVQYSQSDILSDILHLNSLPRFEVDVTYGNGVFYRDGVPEPSMKFDIDPQVPDVIEGDSRDLPLSTDSVGSAIFDPPFLTYVRAGRTGNGDMALGKRFSGYWTYDELSEHYEKTIQEMPRVLKKKGILVVKCQDIIHNHRMHPTHIKVVEWGIAHGFRLKDLFVLSAKHRMPSPNRAGTQKHARIFHSYFLVLEKVK